MVLWQFLIFKSLSKFKKQYVFTVLCIMKGMELKGNNWKQDLNSAQNLGDCFRFCDYFRF